MIAKPEWTQSNAQQNTEQLQNPTTGATHFSLYVVASVKTMVCYLNCLSCDLLRSTKNFRAVKSNKFADIIDISRVLTIIISAST